MKSAPPKAEQVGEILSDSRDAGPKGFEVHKLRKDELAEFLSKGQFTTTVDPTLQRIMQRTDKSANGGPIYCSGVFATKDGRVFKFTRLNQQVLEIRGVDGGGYLVVD